MISKEITREEMNREMGLTEEELDRMAAEYEAGNWEGETGEVVLGRPKLFDEDMETISFRLPLSRIHGIEVVSRRLGISKSEFMRQAIDAALVSVDTPAA